MIVKFVDVEAHTKDDEIRIIEFNLSRIGDTLYKGTTLNPRYEFVGRLQPSIRGKLLNVSYEIEVCPKIDGWVFHNISPIKIPLQIVSRLPSSSKRKARKRSRNKKKKNKAKKNEVSGDSEPSEVV